MTKQEVFTTAPWSPWDDDLNQAIKTALGGVMDVGLTESSEDIWDILLGLQYPYMDDDWQLKLDGQEDREKYPDCIENIKNPKKRIKAKVRHFSRANKTHDWLIHQTSDGGRRDALEAAWEQYKRGIDE